MGCGAFRNLMTDSTKHTAANSTSHSNQQQKLQQSVEQDAERIKKAEKHKHSLLIYSSYVGALGMVLVLPIVGGAYLGRWLDSFNTGFSISWTISLIFVGVLIGVVNAYYLISGKL